MLGLEEKEEPLSLDPTSSFWDRPAVFRMSCTRSSEGETERCSHAGTSVRWASPGWEFLLRSGDPVSLEALFPDPVGFCSNSRQQSSDQCIYHKAPRLEDSLNIKLTRKHWSPKQQFWRSQKESTWKGKCGWTYPIFQALSTMASLSTDSELTALAFQLRMKIALTASGSPV